jgi:hypothetical protein
MFGQELVERRVEQPHVDRQPVHDLEQLGEVLELLLLELDERGRLGLVVLGEDDALDQRQPVPEELVLGAAQPDAGRAVRTGPAAVVGGVGVGADADLPAIVGPLQQPLEAGVVVRGGELDLTGHDVAGGPHRWR